MPHATIPSPGLQALVLCGPGLSLNTFTSNPKDLPKALIPIANRPMVWYAVDWCHRMGVTDITLITPPESEPALTAAFSTHPELTSLPSPKPSILAPADLGQTSGTAELLRLPEVQKSITSDFVILPCDLVSEMDGTRVIQQWMTLNPASGSSTGSKGGLGVFYPTFGLEGISHKKDETDFIATAAIDMPAVPPPQGSIRPQIEELVLSMPTDTLNDKLEEGKDQLRLRQRLSLKYGRVKMKTKHRDAHVYVFPRWVKDYAARNEKFESISEDLLGSWAKAQWQPGLGERLALNKVLTRRKSRSGPDEAARESLEDPIDPAILSSTKSSLAARSASSATFASRVGTTAETSSSPIPPLLAYVQPAPAASTIVPTASQPLIRRVDTTTALMGISLYLAKQTPPHPLAHENKIHPSASIGAQSRVAQEDCLIAENVKVGIRCNLKETVIGANCEIGNNVRLTKCLLMDGVVIGDGVTLTGCAVGRRARIEGMSIVDTGAKEDGAVKGKGKKKDDDDERTKLTDCEVAPNYAVEAGTEAKGEKMMGFDTENLDEFEDEVADDGEDL